MAGVEPIPNPKAYDGQTALEELRWLERLAMRLVSDPERARDLSQEALLAAHRSKTLSADRRRPWLVRTLRNLASKSARGAGRRSNYEREGAKAEALPSAQELAERAEVQRVLLELVGALPEHYRTPILLRYYEGARAKEIAAQLDLPLRTVHTRLQRGMQLLRERMDANHPGGRSGWMGALLLPWSGTGGPPLPAPSTSLPTASGRNPWMSLASWPTWVLGAAAVTGILIVVPRLHSGGRVDGPAGGGAQASAIEMSVAAQPVARAHRAPATPLPFGSDGATEAGPWGDVIDWEGRPVAGARIEVRPLQGIQLPFDWRPIETSEGDPFVPPELEGERGLTDAGGRFPLPAGGEVMLRASAPGHACALAASWKPSTGEVGVRTRSTAPYVVLAPARPFAGRVVDAFGYPLAGVDVWVGLDEEISVHFDRPFDGQHPMNWYAVTDAEGAFGFEALPWVLEARLNLHRQDLGRLDWPLLEASSVLAMPAPSVPGAPAQPRAERLAGQVVDGRGVGIAGATVVAGPRLVQSDDQGHFALAGGPGVGELWVASPGWAPERFELEAQVAQGNLGGLVMRTPAASLSGRVLNGAGQPLAGRLVWAINPTTVDGAAPLVLESLVVGDGGYRHGVRTGRDGRFRLGGLRPDHGYTLRVLDEATALWIEAGTFVPRDHAPVGKLELRVEDGLLERVEGRLVRGDGSPLAGASVRVQGPGFGIDRATVFAHGEATFTDADGRFVLDRVPTHGVWLRAEHTETLVENRSIEDLTLGGDWVLPLAARLRVELFDPGGDPAFSLLDRNDLPLTVVHPTGLGHREETLVRLLRGRTPWLHVPCSAVTLVVFRHGAESERIPLRLLPGEALSLSH